MGDRRGVLHSHRRLLMRYKRFFETFQLLFFHGAPVRSVFGNQAFSFRAERRLFRLRRVLCDNPRVRACVQILLRRFLVGFVHAPDGRRRVCDFRGVFCQMAE